MKLLNAMKVQGIVDTIDAYDILVINCYEIFLIVLFLQNLFMFWGFFLLSSSVFRENSTDGCERAAGPRSEMEINHLRGGPLSFGLRQYKQRRMI